MTESAIWSSAESPFVIEYSAAAMEGIRLAVSDAFFSLPRGGVEIGGILLGKWKAGRLTVSDYAQLDCEHAFGPSFVLSPDDRKRLAELIASIQGEARPVGWYHSHTRSEIFLSVADLDLYSDFFKEPWQVALVLRPHTYLPMRAGFFVRDAGGSIHSEASYKEFTLEPSDVKPLESPPTATQRVPVASTAIAAAVETRVTGSEPPPNPEPATEAATPLPRFLDQHSPQPPRWAKVALPLAVGAAIGAGAYVTRDLWLPRAFISRDTGPAGDFGLNTLDIVGELQIRWNARSSEVMQAAGGVLSLSGVGRPQEILLDHAHLLSGVFTVARQSDRVDVTLTLTQPDGRQIREATFFLGRLPDEGAKPDSEASRQEGGLAEQVSKIRADLDAEVLENRRLRKSVDDLSRQVRELK
jgi:proteasome lid subunit RPN8/RPN11